MGKGREGEMGRGWGRGRGWRRREVRGRRRGLAGSEYEQGMPT